MSPFRHPDIDAVNGNVYGDSDDDTIIGGPGNDDFDGGDGDDSIDGGAGNDVLHGGAGIDMLIGGAGNDVMNGDDDSDFFYAEDNAQDTITGGGGLDFLESADSDFNFLETLPNEDIWSSIEVFPRDWPGSLE